MVVLLLQKTREYRIRRELFKNDTWISLQASCGLGSLMIPGHEIHSKGDVKPTFLCGCRCMHNSQLEAERGGNKQSGAYEG